MNLSAVANVYTYVRDNGQVVEWQTRGSQKAVPITRREGSTPSLVTCRWFPGSAWEPTASAALRRGIIHDAAGLTARGGASRAVRFQVEPGNEGKG